MDFWSLPIGVRPDPLTRDERGQPLLQDHAGNRYTQATGRPAPGLLDYLQWQDQHRVSGDPQSASLGAAVQGLLSGAWDGISAPARAAQGEPVTYGDAVGLALDTMGAGAFVAVPEDALAMAAMRDPRLWHEASDIKLQRPVDEMEFDVRPTGSLEPARDLDIASLKGRTLMPAFGDRTRAGVTLEGINGYRLPDPVLQQGGVDFMREQGMGVWASEPDALRKIANRVSRVAQEGQDPVLAYTAMGSQAGDFSTMMSEAVLGQIPGSRISAPVAASYDETIRSTVDPDWPGILSPNAESYVASMNGSNRRLLWQEMDAKAYRENGFPDVGATRLAITEPSLMNARPLDTGRGFAAPDTSGAITTTPEVPHRTYGAQLGGSYLGQLPESVPGELIWRDFFGGRRAAGAPVSSDQRSFLTSGGIRQIVDDQMIEEVSAYLERARAQRP